MSVLPVALESEILDGLQSALNASESDPNYSGSHELPNHDTKLSYMFTYYNYHRMGEIQHGVEVIFRLRHTPNLVKSDVEAIENALTRILLSTLSFNEMVELEYEGDAKNKSEGDEYVFVEEIVHSFGEQT